MAVIDLQLRLVLLTRVRAATDGAAAALVGQHLLVLVTSDTERVLHPIPTDAVLTASVVAATAVLVAVELRQRQVTGASNAGSHLGTYPKRSCS